MGSTADEIRVKVVQKADNYLRPRDQAAFDALLPGIAKRARQGRYKQTREHLRDSYRTSIINAIVNVLDLACQGQDEDLTPFAYAVADLIRIYSDISLAIEP